MKIKIILIAMLALPLVSGVSCKKGSLSSDCYEGKIISLKASEIATHFESSWGLIEVGKTITNGLSNHAFIAFDIASVNLNLEVGQIVHFKLLKLTSVRFTTGLFPNDSYQYLASIELCNK